MTRPTRAAVPGIAAAFAAGALLAYVAVRAHTLSFTFDESYTYTRYVHLPAADLLQADAGGSNSHLLNTLAMKASEGLFGDSELALRAPNVLACALYLVAVASALARVRSWALRALGFAVAALNPYLIDFFSVARGYGLVLGFVAAAAASVLAFRDDGRARSAVAAVGFAGLAVLSHFTALAAYAGVIAALVVGVFVVRPVERPRVRRVALTAVLPTAALAAIALPAILRVREREGFQFYGGERGFWQDTVHSLTWNGLYQDGREAIAFAVDGLVAALVAVGVAAAVVATVRRRMPPRHAVPLTLLVVAALASVAQHYVLGSPYIVGRMALLFVPLFALWLVSFLDEIVDGTALRRVALGLSAAVAVIAAANLSRTVNVSYVLDWRYDAATERMLDDLRRTENPAPGTVVRLGSSWFFEPTINFYRETKNLSWVSPIVRDCRVGCVEGVYDYYYVIGTDTALVLERGAKVVREYRVSGSVLAARPPP